jgi:hypothetical protein
MSRRRKWIVAAAAVLAIGAAAVGLRVGPYLTDGDEYATVRSIELQPEYQDDVKLAAAWKLPVAATYPQPLEYQSNSSFCAPASAANLLRSLGVEATQKEVIDETAFEPIFGVLIGGLTLDELATLLRARTVHRVSVVRDLTLPELRRHLESTNDPGYRYIANFHRGPLFGRGHGHFSPLLGYLADEDLVLVGDVNRDYRPFLVKSQVLWQAIDTVDTDSGAKRGLVIVEAGASK